jgi:hypothetical protein
VGVWVCVCAPCVGVGMCVCVSGCVFVSVGACCVWVCGYVCVGCGFVCVCVCVYLQCMSTGEFRFSRYIESNFPLQKIKSYQYNRQYDMHVCVGK